MTQLYRQQIGDNEVVEAIPLSRLNCLHWIIFAKRDDMYKYVMENFFTSGAKTNPGDQ